ncbi:hypothetical protein SEMRO_38_G023770.1 [Seminavis robusta]|uniref:Uncharacterized protein n=1 Tax=Seminavis robusta TaxID=568900 RepID=A0A9N8H2K4_9STRA|nr:hypothetical protein SEMRO_38_G023770.1 [Seminavis robusta]|eukprot:Sro38_g023770.1 n/a (253) ;mRNA; r:92514-93272
MSSTPVSSPNRPGHDEHVRRQWLKFQQDLSFCQAALDGLKREFDLDVQGRSNLQVKRINLLRKAAGSSPLTVFIYGSDVYDIFWVKHDGYPLPDVNVMLDGATLDNLWKIKLMMPNPSNHKTLTDIFCEKFNWDVVTFTDRYDRFLGDVDLVHDELFSEDEDITDDELVASPCNLFEDGVVELENEDEDEEESTGSLVRPFDGPLSQIAPSSSEEDDDDVSPAPARKRAKVEHEDSPATAKTAKESDSESEE